jgi:UDP-N-acetyl-D-mannosaminuronic acid dehydrogenase
VVEPHAHELPIEFTGTAAKQVELDWALRNCGVLIVLVDHDAFRRVPLEARAGKLVYDTRGIWPDQPQRVEKAEMRKAG